MKLREYNYVFLDESGKPEVYSSRGVNLVEKNLATKYLVIAAVRSSDQLLIQQQVTDFKLLLLKDETLKDKFSSVYTLDAFHANSDYPIVREKFYEFINTLNIKIDVIVVKKLICSEVLKRNPGKLYGVIAGQLLKNICHQSQKTEIIFSRKDSKLKLRQELVFEAEKVRVDYLKEKNNLTKQFVVSYMHNPHYTHGGLQIADYIAYAVFQVFEFGKTELYEIVKNKISKIHDFCNKKYFTQSNPLQLSN